MHVECVNSGLRIRKPPAKAGGRFTKIILVISSPNLIDKEDQMKVRRAVEKVLKVESADLDDIMKFYDEYAGMRLPRKGDSDYVG